MSREFTEFIFFNNTNISRIENLATLFNNEETIYSDGLRLHYIPDKGYMCIELETFRHSIRDTAIFNLMKPFESCILLTYNSEGGEGMYIETLDCNGIFNYIEPKSLGFNSFYDYKIDDILYRLTGQKGLWNAVIPKEKWDMWGCKGEE